MFYFRAAFQMCTHDPEMTHMALNIRHDGSNFKVVQPSELQGVVNPVTPTFLLHESNCHGLVIENRL